MQLYMGVVNVRGKISQGKYGGEMSRGNVRGNVRANVRIPSRRYRLNWIVCALEQKIRGCIGSLLQHCGICNKSSRCPFSDIYYGQWRSYLTVLPGTTYIYMKLTLTSAYFVQVLHITSNGNYHCEQSENFAQGRLSHGGMKKKASSKSFQGGRKKFLVHNTWEQFLSLRKEINVRKISSFPLWKG